MKKISLKKLRRWIDANAHYCPTCPPRRRPGLSYVCADALENFLREHEDEACTNP